MLVFDAGKSGKKWENKSRVSFCNAFNLGFDRNKYALFINLISACWVVSKEPLSDKFRILDGGKNGYVWCCVLFGVFGHKGINRYLKMLGDWKWRRCGK